jgi:hypothetical protein
MAELMLVKTPSGALAPADDASREAIARLPMGQGVRADVRRARNVRFHRKAFALFKLAFEHWEPQTPLTYKGLPVEKDFDRFRKDMTILAGFYKSVFNARGEVRLEAESLSFGAMDEERFRKVYHAVLNVCWKHVLRNFAGYSTPEEVERVINKLLEFE